MEVNETTSTHDPLMRISVFLTLFAVVLAIASFRADPLQLSAYFVLLVVGVVVSENFAVSIPGASVSLSYLLGTAAIVLVGPSASGLVAASAGFNRSDIQKRIPLSVILFNLSQLFIVATMSGWIYVFLGGRVLLNVSGSGVVSVQPLTAPELVASLIPMAAAAVFAACGNVVIVGIGAAARHSMPIREAVGGMGWIIPVHIGLAFVGYLIAQVLAVSALGFLLLVFPLLVARQVYERYLALNQSYIETVRSLVLLIEAKDSYTRGHSERVAMYARRLGQRMGLSSKALTQIEYAAWLHDLGKVAVPMSILKKEGKLSDEERQTINAHPRRGSELVSRVPTLVGIAPIVRAHHERWDGKGYCDGLAGYQIPAAARVLALADSFDAMTSERPYRRALSFEEAITELDTHSGSQFDPSLVALVLGDPSVLGDSARDEIQ